MPSVYDFDDYRAFVQAWIDERENRSQAALARRTEMTRSNMSMILSGQRELALAKASTVARELGLEGEEVSFFEALVRLAHGPSLAIRQAARAHIYAVRDFRNLSQSTPDQAGILGSWLHGTLIAMQDLDDPPSDPDALAQVLWPRTSAEAVAQAMADTVEAGVVADGPGPRSDRSGPWGHASEMSEPTLAEAARRHHHDALRHAASAIETFGPEERMVTTLTVGVSREALPRLMEALQEAQQAALVPFRSGSADTVVTLVTGLFPRMHDDDGR
ncbi:MAG: TIGR02147 family protein [Myxococcota bacterium]